MAGKSVTKTRMFQLLRLLDSGAARDELVREAWHCWQALPQETKETMLSDRAANAADLRRVRLWATAYRGGNLAAQATINELRAQGAA